jgi:GNAT superfamily N-acetyltransferase/nucleotide-binding universal stress UspA family protein
VTALRDGARVRIRPIEPEDRAMVVAGFERMSPESRYRRFFSAVPRLTGSQLDYLTMVDHHDHEALVAIDEASGDGVAVARYVRTGEGVAEPAIAVIDDWQGRGLASVLLDALVERAREEGIRTFAAPVLADNRTAIRAFERLGATTVTHKGREVELAIELPERERAPALHQLLRAVAAGALRPALGFGHRLMTRRSGEDAASQHGVVVGVREQDGERVLRAARRLAVATGAPVHLVASRLPVLDDRAEAEQRLRRAADELGRAGVEAHVHLRHGDLAASLVDVAADERARTIVVDGGGEGGVGSVWDHLAHHAPCNVLIVRDDD